MKRNYRHNKKCTSLTIYNIHTLHVIYTHIYSFKCVYIKQPERWRTRSKLHEQIKAELISLNRLWLCWLKPDLKNQGNMFGNREQDHNIPSERKSHQRKIMGGGGGFMWGGGEQSRQSHFMAEFGEVKWKRVTYLSTSKCVKGIQHGKSRGPRGWWGKGESGQRGRRGKKANRTCPFIPLLLWTGKWIHSKLITKQRNIPLL